MTESGSTISVKAKLNEKKRTTTKLEKSKDDSKETQDVKGVKGDKDGNYSEDDEFNPSLAAMEEEIKPQVI